MVAARSIVAAPEAFSGAVVFLAAPKARTAMPTVSPARMAAPSACPLTIERRGARRLVGDVPLRRVALISMVGRSHSLPSPRPLNTGDEFNTTPEGVIGTPLAE